VAGKRVERCLPRRRILPDEMAMSWLGRVEEAVARVQFVRKKSIWGAIWIGISGDLVPHLA
jgi:hypothetical protein